LFILIPSIRHLPKCGWRHFRAISFLLPLPILHNLATAASSWDWESRGWIS